MADSLGLGARRRQRDQYDLVCARVAIAFEVIFGDRLGVRRHYDFNVGSLAPVGFEQLFDTANFGRGFVGREIETAPAVAILGHPSQGWRALTAENYRQLRALHWLRIAAYILEIHIFAAVTADLVAPQF